MVGEIILDIGGFQAEFHRLEQSDERTHEAPLRSDLASTVRCYPMAAQLLDGNIFQPVDCRVTEHDIVGAHQLDTFDNINRGEVSLHRPFRGEPRLFLDNLDSAATFAAFHQSLVPRIDHAVAATQADRHLIALPYRDTRPGFVDDKSADLLVPGGKRFIKA